MERHTRDMVDEVGYSSFEEDDHEERSSSEESLHAVSLLAIARPAKPKGNDLFRFTDALLVLTGGWEIQELQSISR